MLLAGPSTLEVMRLGAVLVFSVLLGMALGDYVRRRRRAR